MSGDKTWCDECGRIKDKANHWHQIGVTRYIRETGRVNIEIGDLLGPHEGHENMYVVMDLCGDQCFQKVLGKLLRLNPTEADGEAG